MMLTWTDAAKYCEEVFGTYVDWDEGFFICPECDEPIYDVDWEDHGEWNMCPVCECIFEDIG